MDGNRLAGLVRVACPAAARGVDWAEMADVVSTANLSLTGTPTIDGQATGVGSIVLAAGQTTTANNGRYIIKTGGVWKKIDAPYAVAVFLGSTHGPSWWFRTDNPAAGAYEKASGSGGGGLRMQIHAIYGDYLACYAWNGSAFDTGTIINVARPYLLRCSVTSWNGQTFSSFVSYQQRSATNGSVTETQKITPEYVVGDEITALQKDSTGVTVSGADLTLEEVEGGRQWMQSA